MAAQVHHDPGDVPEEGDGDGGADEGQQWLHYSKANDIISTLGSITWGHKHRGLNTKYPRGET